jgi:hypothetical protein
VRPGDFVHAVNGVACSDYQHASQLLRNSKGSIKLKLSAAPLPCGWTAHVDREGQAYFVHKVDMLKAYSHPFAADGSYDLSAVQTTQ